MPANKKSKPQKQTGKPKVPDFDKTVLDIDLGVNTPGPDSEKTLFINENQTPPAAPSPIVKTKTVKAAELDKTALDIDIRSLTRGFEETLMISNPVPQDSIDHTVQVHVGDLEQDMDKTALDIDIKKFNKGFDETLMVYLPKHAAEEEDIDDFFDEDERTGDFLANESSISQELFDPDLADENPAADEREELPEEPHHANPEIAQPFSEPIPQHDFLSAGTISIFYLSLSSVLLFLMVVSTIETLVRHSPLALAGVLVSALGVIPILGIILKHWSGRTGFLILTTMAFALAVYGAYRLPTHDALSLHLVKLPLASYLGPMLTGLGLMITAFLWRKPGIPLFSKLASLGASGLLLLALFFSLIERQSLEATIWSSRFLTKLPIYLRPGFVAISFSFVLYFWSLFVSLLFTKSTYRVRFYSWLVPCFIISMLAIAMGVKLLLR